MDNLPLKKSVLCTSIVLALGLNTQLVSAGDLGANNNNFTMLSPAGDPVGGTNVIKITWDGTYNTDVATAATNMTIFSPTPFFGTPWFAHDVQVFGPGTHIFEACPAPIDLVTKIAADGSTGCGKSKPQTMVVGSGQVGVHMLFDWNSSVNIDVVNVWDVDTAWGFGPLAGVKSNLQSAQTGCVLDGGFADPTTPECQTLLQTKWLFTATDPDGDTVPGTGMVDGPFKKFNAAFNIRKPVVVELATIENTSTTTDALLANNMLPVTSGDFTIVSFEATTTQGGSVTDNGDNTYSYLPPVNYIGKDSFSYAVTDGYDHVALASGTDNTYNAKASVVIDVGSNTVTEKSAADGFAAGGTDGDGESGGIGAASLFAPLMLMLLPLRLFYRKK